MKPYNRHPFARELTDIFRLLTVNAPGHDRDILIARMRKLIEHERVTEEFHQAAETAFNMCRSVNTFAAEQNLTLFYDLVSEIKHELRLGNEVSVLLSVGVSANALFQRPEPPHELSEETCQQIADALRRHYINPKARISVHHQMLRNNMGAALDINRALPLLLSMRACSGVRYDREDLFVPDGYNDPIIAYERDRNYACYLRHLMIAVTVPADELVFVHPCLWGYNGKPDELRLNAATHPGDFAPARVLATPFGRDIVEALAPNLAGFNASATDPFPFLSGINFIEETLAPMRIVPYVVNAAETLGVAPETLCASLAVFQSRPDAAKQYATEIRIALSHTSARERPFSGECVMVVQTGTIRQTVENFARMLEVTGITDITVHEGERYYEVEDNGRIYVNTEGVSVTLSEPPFIGHTPVLN